MKSVLKFVCTKIFKTRRIYVSIYKITKNRSICFMDLSVYAMAITMSTGNLPKQVTVRPGKGQFNSLDISHVCLKTHDTIHCQ